jgi:ectoine hydroxylase-related dioxygenase (phytanoyl-CoA dioxygenase family)
VTTPDILRGVSVTSAEQQAEFRDRGFVVVPDLLTLAECEQYGREVETAVRRRKAGDLRTLAEKSRYEQSFLQVINLWEDSPGVRALTFHPRICEAAAELVGAERLRLWHDQALFKEPGGRETDPHQDQPYWPIEETDTLTAWIPLDGSTLESGAMGYVPGSHRIGLRRFVNIFSGEPENVLERPEVRAVAPVFVEVPRGGVAFHHGLTVHLARPNRTDRMRRVHTMIFFRDGSTRRARGQHPCVDRAGIAIGAAIDSDVTPIAWPRPRGNLPPPPPPLRERTNGVWPESPAA